MRGWEEEILEQYNIDVKNMRKVRNGILCEGEEEVYLAVKTTVSDMRLSMISQLLQELKNRDFTETDMIISNKEEKLSCQLEDGTRYIVKKWFIGKECDVKKEKELLNAVKNMTRLHSALERPVIWGGSMPYQAEELQQKLVRRNRELKKVRSFMRKKVDKGAFETAFLSSFDVVYEGAEAVLDRLKQLNYDNLKINLTHGDYNFHNLLMLHDGIVTTNFEHFAYDVQLADFYYFLRKAMEKNRWDVKLGEKMLNCYQRTISISKDELEYLGICMAYPEKFWKAANSYARAKKTWVSAKNIEKLELVIQQKEEKRLFLEQVLDFRL